MFIRYPGSKAKLWKEIFAAMPFDMECSLFVPNVACYCEPFFGGGAIGWKILTYLSGTSDAGARSPRKTDWVVINDADPGICALWKTVRDDPRALLQQVSAFRPSPEHFYEFKRLDGDTSVDPAVQAFRKLVLHQLSVSGYGFKSGGPIGGKSQGSAYRVDCRWNKVRIGKRVIACHHLLKTFRRVDILCGDFAACLGRVPDSSLVYLDPPYYEKGDMLYRYAMSDEDHARLASVLKSRGFAWVLSYDDQPAIRALYSWAFVRTFNMVACNQTVKRGGDGLPQKRRKNRELIITPREW